MDCKTTAKMVCLKLYRIVLHGDENFISYCLIICSTILERGMFTIVYAIKQYMYMLLQKCNAILHKCNTDVYVVILLGDRY